MLNFRSIKLQLILYLICLAVFLAVKDKDPSFLFTALAAVISAVAAEALILYFKTKKFQISESAGITGLIIGYVLSSDELWWKFVLAASLAILSKYLIRFQKKHIFNPAAFGLFLTIVFFGGNTQWRGTYLWYILAPFGVYFAYKIKKTEVVIGYALVAFILFAAQAFLQRVSLWNIFLYFSYFYIFVMVIEPKTTPLNSAAKYLFGMGLAGLIFVLTEAGVRFDAEIFGLLVMNAAGALLLNKLSLKKGDAV